MSRGGKRPGAGRRATIASIQERWSIGGQCEHLWRLEYAKRVSATIEAQTQNASVVWAQAKSVPVSERASWLGTFEGRAYFDDLEFALKEDQGISQTERPAGRRLRIQVRRPKGAYSQIVRQMAQAESERRGTTISEAMVERCWAEFRALERSLANDL